MNSQPPVAAAVTAAVAVAAVAAAAAVASSFQILPFISAPSPYFINDILHSPTEKTIFTSFQMYFINCTCFLSFFVSYFSFLLLWFYWFFLLFCFILFGFNFHSAILFPFSWACIFHLLVIQRQCCPCPFIFFYLRLPFYHRSAHCGGGGDRVFVGMHLFFFSLVQSLEIGIKSFKVVGWLSQTLLNNFDDEIKYSNTPSTVQNWELLLPHTNIQISFIFKVHLFIY